MDKLERIVHLLVEALSKARELTTFKLDLESRQRASELMKRVTENQKRVQTLIRTSEGNGKGLDKAELDSEDLDKFEAIMKPSVPGRNDDDEIPF